MLSHRASEEAQSRMTKSMKEITQVVETSSAQKKSILLNNLHYDLRPIPIIF
jgi:hypothetical protein